MAPQGQDLVARDPKEVAIVEVPGWKSGAKFWPGLMTAVEEVTRTAAAEGLWASHACDNCRKDIEVDGETHSVNVATVFALTSTRHAECKVEGCHDDLPERGGPR